MTPNKRLARRPNYSGYRYDLRRYRKLHRLQYTDCVEVCPVDCFYEGENTLVIHPDECIDCGVCEPECPADAIRPDTEPDMEKWVEFNRKYAEIWPVIISKKDPMPGYEERDGEEGKMEKYFSEAPGEGG